jgi:chromatin assembly factor 1 subunit A
MATPDRRNDSATMSEKAASSPSTSRKRSHDGTVLPSAQNEVHDAIRGTPSPAKCSGTPPPTIGLDRSRQASPAGSTTGSSLTELTDLTGEASKPSLPVAPAKKRKLTFAEREVEKAVRKQEKETREKQKAEDKARREEEKRLKDEEKRKREEEKEATRRERELEKAEKQKVKDAEKRAKEDEKRKKEEDKEKKERVSMDMGEHAPLLTADSRKCESAHSSAGRMSPLRSQLVIQTMSQVVRLADDPLS